MAIKKKAENDFKFLNYYSHNPTSIPPFALESNFLRGNELESGYVKIISSRCKDNVNASNPQYYEDPEIANKFSTLDSEWGGEERLKNIFNIPDIEKMSFENFEDKKKWRQYISEIKELYHIKPKKAYTSTFTCQNYSNSSIICKEWIRDEINKEKEHWIGFKNQQLKQYKPIIKNFILNNIFFRLFLRLIIIGLCVAVVTVSSNIIANSRAERVFLEDKPFFNNYTIDLMINFSDLIFNVFSNSLAIIYNLYIGYDEFAGKPIGLNNPTSHAVFLMLDLFFIIVENVNLSLSMNYIINTRHSFNKKDNQLNENFKSIDITIQLLIKTFCQQEQLLILLTFLLELIWTFTFCIGIIKILDKTNSNTSYNRNRPNSKQFRIRH
ncbi:hypothetical protein TPHA_0A03210 [Tetrapisispora phaffii CBS 4417]|uniref:Uncharacterized protein n=1 Tax=Tetrapisispora phaffii (strain ATCC 24235 / CBS 4417 / NBRC 1672 / NRRL Y-8282 / UCD 70-5) TaxID=1071381 RepID=G8BNC0_TETPH|nr:hypothetical protein TPHA_0A03210 [Tetrapisispora phaffii CBS 4417]CCE61398.1 hypothetical protein TPHA_0A03210 [Tetrapisispora phaffii CBS 4417]